MQKFRHHHTLFFFFPVVLTQFAQAEGISVLACYPTTVE